MSFMRLVFRSFLRGGRSLGPVSKFFRSALQLPPALLRFKNLKAPAPVTQPYRNRFWFRAPLLLLVPAVVLVTLFALRHSHRREAGATLPIAPLEANWQAVFDLSTSTSASPESRRTVFPYSVIPGG